MITQAISALIGAVLVFVATMVTRLIDNREEAKRREHETEKWKQEFAQKERILKEEKEKWELETSLKEKARREEEKRERERLNREKVGAAGKVLVHMHHKINWNCFLAKAAPQQFSAEEFGKYNDEVNKLWPQVLTEIIEIATFSTKSFRELEIVYKDLVNFDSSFAEILYGKFNSQDLAVGDDEELVALLEEINGYESEITKRVINAKRKM